VLPGVWYSFNCSYLVLPGVWYSFTCSYLCVEQRIDGEVYDVDDKMLAFMDHFEGHPEVYNRDMVGKQF